MNDGVPIPEVGVTLRGRVTRFLTHGAILDIGKGLKGFLHGSQVSWLNKRAKIDEVLKLGDELDVVVLEVERSKSSKAVFISLGHLQIQVNPWKDVAEKHPVGSRVKAKVVDFLPFGAIVEFQSGFRALVHDSEVSWTAKKPKATDFLRLGEEIEVVVLLVDKDKRRIQVSYRQLIENPWETFLERFPIGTVTKGRAVSVRDFGVFLMLSNGCLGLLHNTHFPSGVSAFSVGDTLDVTILAYEQDQQRIALSCSTMP